MPGTPGTLSTLSPASACTSITLSGFTPNFSRTASSPSLLVLHRIKQGDAFTHQLHQVLVRRHDAARCPRLNRLPRIGGDEIIGLVIGLFNTGHVESPRGLPDQVKLRAEVSGSLWPVRLVFGINVVAESFR